MSGSKRKLIDFLLKAEAFFESICDIRPRGKTKLINKGQIYARNLFGFGKMDNSYRARSGLYIRRVGRLGSVRGLGVGQTRKDS